MKKKSFITILVMLTLVTAALFSQATGEKNLVPSTQTEVRVIALKGPTGMGLSKLMSDQESASTKSNHYDFTLASAIDEVTARLLKGDVDLAAVPANMASVLYNKTQGKIKAVGINTLGVIYIVENSDSIHSVADLKGKTIYASGKGATPEYALNFILKSNNIDPVKDVDIQFKSEHAECVAAISTNPNAVAMLPEPFVTTAMMKNPKTHVVLDLTEEWERLENGSSMITGVYVGTSDFLENHADAAALFMDQYAASVAYVNENISEAAALIGKYGIVTEAVALKAIKNCNIVFIEGSEMKSKLSGYLSELYSQNPASVGGKLPDDAFYFTR